MYDNEYLLKICIIGSTELKTKVARRFADGKFDPNQVLTLGVEITTKKVQVEDQTVKLIMVDRIFNKWTEFLGVPRPSYYRGASAAIIFYETEDKSSFQAVPDWLGEFRKHIPDPTIPISLVGIKSTVSKNMESLKTQDNVEEITPEDGQQMAENCNMSFYEISLKDDDQLRRVFVDLCKQVLTK